MRRVILLGVCIVSSLFFVGCGPKLTAEERNAPPPRGPGGGYQPPPPGANPGVNGPGGPPMGASMPAGANPNMGR